MAPEAGMEFLACRCTSCPGSGCILARPENSDVRHALFLVHDQVVDDVQVFGLGLLRQVIRRIAVLATVVHVHVQVGAAPWPEVGRQRLDRSDVQRAGLCPPRPSDLTVPVQVCANPCWTLIRPRSPAGTSSCRVSAVEVMRFLHCMLRSNPSSPCIQASPARRLRFPRHVLTRGRRRPPGHHDIRVSASLCGVRFSGWRHQVLLPSRRRRPGHKYFGAAMFVADVCDFPAIGAPAHVTPVEFAERQRQRRIAFGVPSHTAATAGHDRSCTADACRPAKVPGARPRWFPR